MEDAWFARRPAEQLPRRPDLSAGNLIFWSRFNNDLRTLADPTESFYHFGLHCRSLAVVSPRQSDVDQATPGGFALRHPGAPHRRS